MQMAALYLGSMVPASQDGVFIYPVLESMELSVEEEHLFLRVETLYQICQKYSNYSIKFVFGAN